MAYDIVRLVGGFSIFIGCAMGACALLLDNKRGPFAIALVAGALLLVAGSVITAPTGTQSMVQYYLARLLLAR